MSMHRWVPALLLVGLSAPALAQCEPDGDIRFICGPQSPEDLVPVPDTSWVLVSSMIDEGSIHVADTRDHSIRQVFPTPSSEPRHDTETYGDCPGPVATQFRAHGLSLRAGSAGRHTLYVVGHGDRESVEVFEVDANGTVPEVTWIGCAVAPDGVGLNSVAKLPGGGFVATHFNLAGGEVWEWAPSAGWSKVPGTETRGPNGIETSADGRWLYIGGWGAEAMIRVSRGKTPVERDELPVGFHIDNMRFAADGTLLAAGHTAVSIAEIVTCIQQRECDGVSSRAAVIDPDALTMKQIVNYPSNEHIILGTIALRVGDEVWIGQVAEGTKIGRFPFNP